jgi:glutamate 5-kinase
MLSVIKVGTSSVTTKEGSVDANSIKKVADEIAKAEQNGHKVVVVTSGAVTAGIAVLGMKDRPTDIDTLQALSSIGQHRLMSVYAENLGNCGLHAGQVLLTPLDFAIRSQYLHAKKTIERLLELSVIPIINENDAIADDELRFGDNDRLAALVANLLSADMLLLLTDTEGLFDADPRLVANATLIDEVHASDENIDKVATGPVTSVGSGGMASKLSAARIAAFSGIPTVIAASKKQDVIPDAIDGKKVGTKILPNERTLTARQLWIAFAMKSKGKLIVDDGAKEALLNKDASLLTIGVSQAIGDFESEDAVEVCSLEGKLFAKGISRHEGKHADKWIKKHSKDLPDGYSSIVIHRDDLVILR